MKSPIIYYGGKTSMLPFILPMIFNRIWAMPNASTFTIEPIASLLRKYVPIDGAGWIDPFAGWNSPAAMTNDLNPDRNTMFHLPASKFADELCDNNFDGILFDPPYSNRQIKEVYESIGLSFTQSDAQSLFQKEKKLFAHKIKVNGIAICFGWNSGGFGKKLGFDMIEILLVPHGGGHHDTIVTVEKKI